MEYKEAFINAAINFYTKMKTCADYMSQQSLLENKLNGDIGKYKFTFVLNNDGSANLIINDEKGKDMYNENFTFKDAREISKIKDLFLQYGTNISSELTTAFRTNMKKYLEELYSEQIKKDSTTTYKYINRLPYDLNEMINTFSEFLNLKDSIETSIRKENSKQTVYDNAKYLREQTKQFREFLTSVEVDNMPKTFSGTINGIKLTITPEQILLMENNKITPVRQIAKLANKLTNASQETLYNFFAADDFKRYIDAFFERLRTVKEQTFNRTINEIYSDVVEVSDENLRAMLEAEFNEEERSVSFDVGEITLKPITLEELVENKREETRQEVEVIEKQQEEEQEPEKKNNWLSSIFKGDR